MASTEITNVKNHEYVTANAQSLKNWFNHNCETRVEYNSTV